MQISRTGRSSGNACVHVCSPHEKNGELNLSKKSKYICAVGSVSPAVSPCDRWSSLLITLLLKKPDSCTSKSLKIYSN